MHFLFPSSFCVLQLCSIFLKTKIFGCLSSFRSLSWHCCHNGVPPPSFLGLFLIGSGGGSVNFTPYFSVSSYGDSSVVTATYLVRVTIVKTGTRRVLMRTLGSEP